MNIVFLHCHFQRGGVTQVVENQVRALDGASGIDSIGLVSSTRTDGIGDETRQWCQHLTIAEMDYDSVQDSAWSRTPLAQRVSRLSEKLDRKLREQGFLPDSTILHWHNHSLGKNVAAPRVAARMADAGWRLLLQIHDFAEEFRPENLGRLLAATRSFNGQSVESSSIVSPADLARFCYPLDSNIRYATLTDADADLLAGAGIPDEWVNVLPNCVRLPADDSNATPASDAKNDALRRVRKANGLPSDATWAVYPVRGIRRKNVGELLLLSNLLPPTFHTGITLCPTTPIERASYERWRSVAAEVAPRVVFDAGMHDDIRLVDNLTAAEFILSTSVAEGFGMVFLEPWLVGRRVIARDLPTTTNDFRAAGLDCSSLYESVEIPFAESMRKELNEELRTAYEVATSGFPDSMRPPFVAEAIGETFDFARLVPQRQQWVLEQAAKDTGFASAIESANERLLAFFAATPLTDMIESNERVVRKSYSIQQCGNQLLSIYGSLMLDSDSDKSTGGQPLTLPDSANLVEAVCSQRPFYPCRTEQL